MCHCGILVPPLDSDICILMICRLAVKGDLPGLQLTALENMQYSHMVRFNNVKNAK